MRQLKISKQITNRENESLDKYLQEISKIDLIDAEEEFTLAQKARDGDIKALDKLVKSNLRFVVSVAKQYQNQGMTLGDLINEGNMGLIKAAQRFDETRGFKFISYAVWWIRQSILQAIAEQSRIVRLPLNRLGHFNKVNKASHELEQKFEREPTIDELEDVLDITANEIISAMNASGRHMSLDAPFGSDEEKGRLVDVIEDVNADVPDLSLLNDSLKTEVKRALTSLTQRENDVIKHYYGLDGNTNLTLEEIGEMFNLTRERVRQIKEKAIRRLRQYSRSSSLKVYLS